MGEEVTLSLMSSLSLARQRERQREELVFVK